MKRTSVHERSSAGILMIFFVTALQHQGVGKDSSINSIMGFRKFRKQQLWASILLYECHGRQRLDAVSEGIMFVPWRFSIKCTEMQNITRVGDWEAKPHFGMYINIPKEKY